MTGIVELRAKISNGMTGHPQIWTDEDDKTLLALLDEVERLQEQERILQAVLNFDGWAVDEADPRKWIRPEIRPQTQGRLVIHVRHYSAALNSSTGQQNAPVAEGDAP